MNIISKQNAIFIKKLVDPIWQINIVGPGESFKIVQNNFSIKQNKSVFTYVFVEMKFL